ncbi:MAG: DUF4920 domain-containing protein [Bacteroidia bacterium]
MKAIFSAVLIFSCSLLIAQKSDSFGDKIKAKGAIEGAEFLQKIEGKDSLDVKIVAPIQSVCQKKGCWMNIDLGNNQSMMVRFKDYAFFVPKDASGRKTVVEGRAFREVLSVETLRHYAEDAGKSKEEIEAITAPETRLSFEANGVLIYAD